MKPRQVPIFLYWRVENVKFWINSIGHLGWLSCILNFPRFHKTVNSLELWKYISENSSPKGSFWRNKRKSEFSLLSADSRYLLAVALKWPKIVKSYVNSMPAQKKCWGPQTFYGFFESFSVCSHYQCWNNAYLLLPSADICHLFKAIHDTTKYAPYLRWSRLEK